MSDMEQLAKLRDKYNQLKQANKVLKEGLLEKQEGCSRLEQQLKEKDGTIRQQLEEIDHLQFQNGKVSKQLGTVTAQLEETKQRQQQQQSGWSVGGLISGKQQQEAVQKAGEEIRVLKDELMMKIQENEDLHMQIFETKRQWEEEQVRLQEASSSAAAELEAKRSELELERRKSAHLQSRVEETERGIAQLKDEAAAAHVLTDSLRSTLESERAQARQRIRNLEAELARWVPFDDSRFDTWNAWNLSSRQGREAGRHQQAVAQLRASVIDVCTQSCNMLQMWTKTFGGGSDEESATRLRVRTKMSDTVEKLAKMIGERVPNLLGDVDLVQMVPTAAWVLEFKSEAETILQTHRKFVMYQSMLLLHDWNSSYASRSTQEEAQAQRFVEWLWRLHRRLRSLFSRMRVLSCVQGLSTSNHSASHFAIARRAVKKGRAGTADFTAIALGGNSASSSGAADIRVQTSLRAPVTDVALRVVESVRKALQDVSQCWEGIGRCLSAWAMAQANPSEAAPQEGASVVELLEAVHRFNACLADRATPAMARVVGTQLPGLSPGGSGGSGGSLTTSPVAPSTPLSPTSPLGVAGRPRQACSYVGRAALRLGRAPAALGFEEAVQTQHLAQRLSATGARLSNEMQQQVRRLQVVTDEKAVLAEDLRVLQDDHALLRSNFQVLQDRGGASAAPCTSTSSAAPPPQAPVAGVVGERPPLVGGGIGFELVLSSRQRALLESLSVTAQESAALRQHGFFVDVLSLSPGDVALASGAPEASSAEGPDASSWEVAVRRVYEQHARQLQSQIRVADGRAMELHLKVQQNMDLLREEESVKQGLRDETLNMRAKLESVQEDIATTRKNYDHQLAMLTEHICTLSAKLSDKDSNLAGFQAQKVLCGRCGMWNTMGKLLATENWGTCQTCKEKVLSRS